MDEYSQTMSTITSQLCTTSNTNSVVQSDATTKDKESISSLELIRLLGSGGDERLSIESSTGFNMYGCPLDPTNPSTSIYLSSSTATPISNGAFVHLTEIMNSLNKIPDDNVIDERIEGLRQELLGYFGLTLNDADIVFVPSGTDATLQSVFLAKLCLPRSTTVLTNVILGADEAAGRVSNAASGRHFNLKNIRGEDVKKGAPIAGLHGPDDNSNTRCIEYSYQKCQDEAFIEQSINDLTRSHEDTHIFLHALDTSKLGNRTPSHECLNRIEQQHSKEVLTILIDACQFRISSSRVREHISRNRFVTLTGSKFLAGPPFSGAILVPACFRAQIQKASVQNYMSSELAAYSAISDWPQSWTNVRKCLADYSTVLWQSNIGHFLRLTAAVFELRRYLVIPLEWREQFIIAAGAEIRAAFSTYAGLLQPVVNMKRSSFYDENDEEFRHETIFPFLIRQSSKTFLSEEACKDLYNKLRLQTDAHPIICVIGQPATLSLKEYPEPVTTFRFAIDARTVTDEFERGHGIKPITTDVLQSQLKYIISKIADIINYQHSIKTEDNRTK
ncbi:hypothetical protein I4U23_019980 [Adineta vaga]|nr:hypothetical protein I4U23_019980 [Adineta vaga]